ncbi:MAG: hypothetical protein NZ840_06880 [Anaerolineales bacterium]|nr:hypothetical protein [Anaerolineales bacterium]MDW8161761.1 hypothetical protein [Anaerolineales bacterium]
MTPWFFLFLLSSLLLWFGAFLIARFELHLPPREHLSVSFALAFVLSIPLINLFSHFFPLLWAYLLAALCVLGVGVGRARKLPLQQWLQGLREGFPSTTVLFGLLALFYLINRGLSIFDENYNLPIVARMATGDLPPHFVFDPRKPLAYHYGLHLASALLVQFAQLAPWSAFDLVRAFTHALMLVLAGLWFYRRTNHLWAAVLGALLIYLAGSTQWLLVFLPLPWLEKINQSITLINTAVESGSTLYEVLLSQWKIDGLGPVSYPFAFVNALFKPQTLALTSSGASVGLALCLLLLLDPVKGHPWQNFVISLVLSFVALTAEYLFGLLALGCFGTAFLGTLREKSLRPLITAVQIWSPALLLALAGGGVLSVLFQHQLAALFGRTVVKNQGGIQFTWIWPPSLSTLYFGKLSFFRWETLLLSFLLIGPLVILFPLTLLRLRLEPSAAFLTRSIALGATLALALGLVLGIQDSEGGITRLLDAAILSVLILSFPRLFELWRKGSHTLQSVLALWAVVVCMSGLVTFGINLIAIGRPQTTYFFRGLDLLFYQRYWNRLEPEAQIFDPNPARAIVVFGRSSGITASDYGKWLPEWEKRVSRPDPYELAAAGYTHAYVGGAYWNQLEKTVKALWKQPCVKLIEEQTLSIDYRRLYDITACR